MYIQMSKYLHLALQRQNKAAHIAIYSKSVASAALRTEEKKTAFGGALLHFGCGNDCSDFLFFSCIFLYKKLTSGFSCFLV